jgi:hypothetical protein
MILLHAFKAERALIHFVYCGKIDSLDKSTFQVLCHRKTRNKIRKYVVICVSRPKSASFSSEFGFSGRGAAEA